MLNFPEQKTAILVFAQSANEEIRHKPIAKSHDLFEQLNRHVLAEVEKSGLPFFHISEELQNGDTFGKRFANAIQQVYDHGFDAVITVGNDSPQLKSKHLLSAAKALNNGKSVIGPSPDGGFYLLGLSKENFKKDDFVGFSWQKQSLQKEIRNYLRGLNLEIEKLGYLPDIDSIADIELLLANTFQSISQKIRKLLNSIFNVIAIEFEYFGLQHKPNKHRLYDLVRGSP